MIAGNFPPKQTKYIVAWADIHREELAVLWEIMQNDEEYFKIRGWNDDLSEIAGSNAA